MYFSLRRSLFAIFLALLAVAAVPAYSQSNSPQIQIEERTDARYVVDVTLHTSAEIEALLNRAEKLHESSKTGNINNKAGIALVLHGEEIKLFTKNQYQLNKNIVDKAAKLDANNIIEIKICNTKLKELGLEKKDLPPFIETVPYGPDEIEKLRSKGYLYL